MECLDGPDVDSVGEEGRIRVIPPQGRRKYHPGRGRGPLSGISTEVPHFLVSEERRERQRERERTEGYFETTKVMFYLERVRVRKRSRRGVFVPGGDDRKEGVEGGRGTGRGETEVTGGYRCESRTHVTGNLRRETPADSRRRLLSVRSESLETHDLLKLQTGPRGEEGEERRL